MCEYHAAYRFPNGEVEGFKGTGFSNERALADTMIQILRKIGILNDQRRNDYEFIPFLYDSSRLITKPVGLTKMELATIRKDWKTNVRY